MEVFLIENNELVEIQRIHTEVMEEYKNHLRGLIKEFVEETGSEWGNELYTNLEDYLRHFWLVKPKAASLTTLLTNMRVRQE